VVETRPTSRGDLRLVAWVEPVPGETVSGQRVRNDIRASVPEHWVPTSISLLSQLPLTANAKVDRSALCDPERARPSLETPFASPRTPLEADLARLWSEQLELDAVGIDDRFADLGGDSLALIELLARMAAELGLALPLEAVPRELTVATLARALAEGTQSSAGAAAPLPSQRGVRAALRRRIQRTGPVIGRQALPYGAGLRVQRSVLAQPSIQRRRFAKQLGWVRQWHARVGSSEPIEAEIRRSLLANTWLEWRARALAKPRAFDAWVDVLDDALSSAVARAPSCGVVLVVAHTGVKHGCLLPRVRALRGREFALIHRPDPWTASDRSRDRDELLRERALQFRRAQSVLQRSGAAVIAGDGAHGGTGVDVSFQGRSRRFRVGAAELAVRTGALLVPVFSRLTPEGRVCIEFEPPLVSGEHSSVAQVSDLTHQYALRYIERWPSLYSTLLWSELRNALEPPPGY
jgi:acyl carrier protein